MTASTDLAYRNGNAATIRRLEELLVEAGRTPSSAHGAAAVGVYEVSHGPADRNPLEREEQLDAPQLLSLTFGVGRKGPADQFDPSLIRYRVAPFNLEQLKRYRVGDASAVQITAAACEALGVDVGTNLHQRSKGFITDLTLSYVRGSDRVVRPVLDVLATGTLARLGQARYASPNVSRTVDDAVWDVLTTCGPEIVAAPWTASYFSFYSPHVSTPYLRYVDADSRNALEVARGWAADAAGNLYESAQDGRITFEPVDGRRNREPVATLDAGDVALDVTWSNTLAGLCNRYTVTYGLTESRQEVTVTDDVSVSLYGLYAAGRDTDLRFVEDATTVANLVVGRSSRPRWTMSAVRVNMLRGGLPLELVRALAVADIGDLLEFVGLPSTAPQARYFYVEGLEVELTRHDWFLTLYLSEGGSTGAPLRWQDVSPALTWADSDQLVDTEGEPLTWLSSAAWFDPPTLSGVYRWLDVPADQAWKHLAPGEDRDGGDTRSPTWTSYPENP